MSLHNIQFHDKIRKIPKVCVLLSCRKNFLGTQSVRIGHGKRAIVVRAIAVRRYVFDRRRVGSSSSVKQCNKPQIITKLQYNKVEDSIAIWSEREENNKLDNDGLHLSLALGAHKTSLSALWITMDRPFFRRTAKVLFRMCRFTGRFDFRLNAHNVKLIFSRLKIVRIQ